MPVEIASACKVNLILNILGKRADGFHDLETIMHPVPLRDQLVLEQSDTTDIGLTCNWASLSTGPDNLVCRAARLFLETAGLKTGVRIHLEKRIPMAAGLGGGSANAAATLLGLNALFDRPLAEESLAALAGQLGSDVPFFLHNRPALATGRGERIELLDPFPSLRDTTILLIHPGFGIATAWAYQQLIHHPEALRGRPGRARELLELLRKGTLANVGPAFYNALEAPAYRKYPVLALLKEFLLHENAPAALMSGSGSTLFAILPDRIEAHTLEEKVRGRFGCRWTALIPLS